MTPQASKEIAAEPYSGPWSTGRILPTAKTERMSAEFRAKVEGIEKREVYSIFTSVDDGRSRIKICEISRDIPQKEAEALALQIAQTPTTTADIEKARKTIAELLGALKKVRGEVEALSVIAPNAIITKNGDWKEHLLRIDKAIANAKGQAPPCPPCPQCPTHKVKTLSIQGHLWIVCTVCEMPLQEVKDNEHKTP